MINCSRIDFFFFFFSEFDKQTLYGRSDAPQAEVFAPCDHHGLMATEFLNYRRGAPLPYFHLMADRFRLRGYKEGRSLFAHPYDWRQGSWTPCLIKALVDQVSRIHSQTGQKLDVVR